MSVALSGRPEYFRRVGAPLRLRVTLRRHASKDVPKAQRFPSWWRGAAAHRDSFGPMLQTPTTFGLDRKHRQVNEIRGCIAPGLWDDVAELVLA